LNPRPPRCERGALPAELLPHLRAGKHSRRFPLELSRKGERRSFEKLPGGRVALCAPRSGRRGEPLATIKFSPALPIKSSGRQSASIGSAPLPRRQKKISCREEDDRRRPRDDGIAHTKGIPRRSPTIRRARIHGIPRRARIGAARVRPGQRFPPPGTGVFRV
jgi:hypothetical protein